MATFPSKRLQDVDDARRVVDTTCRRVPLACARIRADIVMVDESSTGGASDQQESNTETSKEGFKGKDCERPGGGWGEGGSGEERLGGTSSRVLAGQFMTDFG